tara:strand:+ start:22 stop:255 length:234 start_codon:yes stop_codon:yes gene_type:complete
VVKTAAKLATKKSAAKKTIKKTIKKTSKLASYQKEPAPKKEANPQAPERKTLAPKIALQVNVRRHVNVRYVMRNVYF